MLKYIKYLHYVIRHKWFVVVECFKCGLIWCGIMHDMSKFLPSEFIPYAKYFYGKYPTIEELKGAWKVTEYGITTKEEIKRQFDIAWLKHQHRNPHHWQHWILQNDEDGIKIIEMPYKYVKEMICDWKGAGLAQGYKSPKDDQWLETRIWYIKNKSKMKLHKWTIKWLDMMLQI